MKLITHYTIASFLFVAIFFFLLFMNMISLIMLRKINSKEEETVPDSYFFAGHELEKA